MNTFSNEALFPINQGHVYYRYSSNQIYIERLKEFIADGIQQNQSILIIDNMRNIPILEGLLKKEFPTAGPQEIHLVNNYDFYLSNGDFNTSTILDHFEKELSRFNNSKEIRSWAQVEWSSTTPDTEKAEEFESYADEYILDQKMLTVCAYSTQRLTERLHETLASTHLHLLTDTSYEISPLYRSRQASNAG
ncbi:MEDS domain-containing protein [Paenisporosarcina cavernae]|uniref:MEDS domain-containing protein n=1 Tax=Paenisporosarcina cavernae TaxID=2320858 RepID=UPI0013C4E7B5|nr:MEDS domain-containing protein [Paenisporosarcina cavernae]